MGSLIDILGSFAIGGMVILLIISFNMKMQEDARESFSNQNIQGNIASSAEVLNYYFYKIGYKASGEKILSADSNSIKFAADINNDGSLDTTSFYLGPKSELASTANPDDVKLYRRDNSSTPVLADIVTRFKLTYYDSLNNEINYSYLSGASGRNQIRGTKINLNIESQDKSENYYPIVEWQKLIRPKNLL